MANDFHSKYANTFDRLQPLKIEMYRLYHDLALDFLPFEVHESFRFLDLGCGTATFANRVLEQYPEARYVALDYSPEMLELAKEKTRHSADRVEFYQRDLNQGLPEGLGTFHLVSAFSAVHHLTDENKARLFGQVHDILEPGGWLFLTDAMSVHFDDDVFRLGRRRARLRMEERFRDAGADIREADELEAIGDENDEDAPDADRIAPLSRHMDWLQQAGFRSIDYVWHFWMEHFIIARK